MHQPSKTYQKGTMMQNFILHIHHKIKEADGRVDIQPPDIEFKDFPNNFWTEYDILKLTKEIQLIFMEGSLVSYRIWATIISKVNP